jgi:hypothetical protein
MTLASLLQANGVLLFVNATLPKTTIDDAVIITVLPQYKLMGNAVGYTFEINTIKYIIETIF